MSAEPLAERPRRARVVEVACDESGFSGSNLLDEDTRVFTHASVRIGTAEARRWVAALRERSPYSAGEYKSAQLFRQRPVLTWLLGPDGPLLGRAAVQLTDKWFLLAGRLSALFADGLDYRSGTSLDVDDYARRMALALHLYGPRYGAQWWLLLQSFIDLLRSKNRTQYGPRIDEFLTAAHRLEPIEPELADALARIRAGRPQLIALRERLFDDRTLLPPLEVLIPALLETTLYWRADADLVDLVHDEQSALTVHRIAQINQLLADDEDVLVLTQTDSRSDPRVQLADLLAGAARQIATAELRGTADPGLTELLRPYLKPSPIWSDQDSWARLTAPAAARRSAAPAGRPRSPRPR